MMQLRWVGEEGVREHQMATERVLQLEGSSDAFWSKPFGVQVRKLRPKEFRLQTRN